MHIGGEKKIFQLVTFSPFLSTIPRNSGGGGVDVRFGQRGGSAKLLVEDVAVKSVKNEGEGT